MSTSVDRIASGTMWMAKLLVEEPDALMRARPGLWEPWGGNDPEPPGPKRVWAGNADAAKDFSSPLLTMGTFDVTAIGRLTL